MKLYETAVVLDSQQKNEEIEETITKFTSFIANNGGEVVSRDDWGKKRLAYEINKKQYGFYTFIRFTAPGTIVSLLEREYKLTESVLRYLTLKVDKLALRQEEMNRSKAEAEARAAEAEEAAKLKAASIAEAEQAAEAEQTTEAEQAVPEKNASSEAANEEIKPAEEK